MGHSTTSGTKSENASPVVSFDYAFLCSNGELTCDRELATVDDASVTILVDVRSYVHVGDF